jgi:hypothetical protein
MNESTCQRRRAWPWVLGSVAVLGTGLGVAGFRWARRREQVWFTEHYECSGGGELEARVYLVGQWDPNALAWRGDTMKIRVEFTATDGFVIKQLMLRNDSRDQQRVRVIVQGELEKLAVDRGCRR